MFGSSNSLKSFENDFLELYDGDSSNKCDKVYIKKSSIIAVKTLQENKSKIVIECVGRSYSVICTIKDFYERLYKQTV